MSNDGVEAGESVPRPTRRSAVRSAASGAIPQPRSAFDRGQCATGTSRSASRAIRSEEHTSELQSLAYLVCRLLLEKKKKKTKNEVPLKSILASDADTFTTTTYMC